MITKALKRALLERPPPPAFLLPWTANLSSTTAAVNTAPSPPPFPTAAQRARTEGQPITDSQFPGVHPSRLRALKKKTKEAEDWALAPDRTQPPLPPPPNPSPIHLSNSVRELLPLLKAQGAHYAAVHVHDRPYLVTQGDSVRLSFFMKGVEPGDVLRLNRASYIGSRDYTLKASAPPPPLKSATATTTTVLDSTTGNLPSHSRVMPTEGSASTQSRVMAPHFIPHIAKGKVSYLDDRLFVCRAVVMGVESEPMRFLEKTKRRQRKVKTVKSKHRYTILKIKELHVRDVDEIDDGGAVES